MKNNTGFLYNNFVSKDNQNPMTQTQKNQLYQSNNKEKKKDKF